MVTKDSLAKYIWNYSHEMFYFAEDTHLNEKTFYQQWDNKVIAEQVITSNTVRNLLECLRHCVGEPLCQAFSLNENMRCVVGSSRSPDVLDDAAGITFTTQQNKSSK